MVLLSFILELTYFKIILLLSLLLLSYLVSQPFLSHIRPLVPLPVINIVALLLLAFIFGMNNSGVVVGPLVSSGFRYRRSIVIAIIGFALGLLLEGHKTGYNILTINAISNRVDIVRSIILLITLVALLVSSYIGIPTSMVNILFASYIGAIMGMNPEYYNEHISKQVLITIIFWIVLPFIAFFLSMIVHRTVLYNVRLLGLISVSKFYSIALQLALFYAAYTIGSNNLGLLYSIGYDVSSISYDLYGITLMAILLFAFALGMINGERVSKFIGEDMIGLTPARVLGSILTSSITLWIATQMRIPSSFLHLLICSLLGVGITIKPSVYNRKHITLLLTSWIFLTLISFIASFMLNSMVSLLVK